MLWFPCGGRRSHPQPSRDLLGWEDANLGATLSQFIPDCYSLRGGVLGYCPAKPPQIPFNDTKIFGYCFGGREGAGGRCMSNPYAKDGCDENSKDLVWIMNAYIWEGGGEGGGYCVKKRKIVRGLYQQIWDKLVCQGRFGKGSTFRLPPRLPGG